MSPEAFAYVAGGAGTGATMRANRAAFDRWRIVPRMLRDVGERDTSVELFGRTLPSPFLIAPIGVLEMAHREAERAVARAVRDTRPADDLLEPGVACRWRRSPRSSATPRAGSSSTGARARSWWRASPGAPRRAAARRSWSRSTPRCSAGARATSTSAGCRSCAGWGSPSTRATRCSRGCCRSRPRAPQPEPKPTFAALRVLIQLTRNYPGPFLPALRSGRARAAVQRFVQIYSRPSLTWADLPFLRERTSVPIVLKGDAAIPTTRGARSTRASTAIVVSNHGGRQVDGAIATLDALPADRRGGGRPDPGAARQRDPERRRHLQGAGARRAGGAAGPPARVRPGPRRRGRRARGGHELHGRLRPDDGPGGLPVGCRRSRARRWCPRRAEPRPAQVGRELAGVCRQLPPRDADHPPARGLEAAVPGAVFFEGDCVPWWNARLSSSTMRRSRGHAQSTSKPSMRTLVRGLGRAASMRKDWKRSSNSLRTMVRPRLCFFKDGSEDGDARLAGVAVDQRAVDSDAVGEPELLGLPDGAAQLVALNDGTEVEAACGRSW